MAMGEMVEVRTGTVSGEVVIREHQPDAPAGLIGEWLDARGIPWRISRRATEPELAGAAAIVTLGSSASAYWSEPEWIARECALLRDADDHGIPVLGVCFGAQALARALGGQVHRAARPELGWVSPESDIPQLRGPFLAWHFDAIDLPPGAVSLASSPRALQAFARGTAMGLQFHPEVTAEIWRSWSRGEPATVAEHVSDPAALDAEVVAAETATRERVFALLDWWRTWLVGSTREQSTPRDPAGDADDVVPSQRDESTPR